jgi:hypothetical protein
MDVNDNAYCLDVPGACSFFASKLAPTTKKGDATKKGDGFIFPLESGNSTGSNRQKAVVWRRTLS